VSQNEKGKPVNNNPSVESIVKFLAAALDCNQRIISNFTGLNASTLSANIEKSFEEVLSKKVGKRLFALFFVVRHFSVQGISPRIIKESLNEFVFPDEEGNFDSVISAIHSDKYTPAVLKNIGEIGLKRYQAKLEAREKLFPAVKALTG